MKRQLRLDFNPLPKRSYDLNLYSSYPCSIMGKKREHAPTWHCFVVFDDEISLVITNFLSK
ncbi:MAG: hypothetical protein R3Y51_00200 [Rikenellaceae bacterium]